MYKGKFQSSSKKRTAVEKERKPKKVKEKTRPSADQPVRKGKAGTIVFYSILGTFILAFCVGLAIAMNALNGWLVRFEASQPEAQCQAVFSELFRDPDWAEIYQLAPGDVTAEEYALYMEQKVGDTALTYIETSAGLSGDKKYIVRCGTEKIATFTLTNAAPEADIPAWELGKVELFYQAELSVYIQAAADHTVLVNGKPLNDSYVIRTVTTKAQEYLPEGMDGYRMKELAVHNLLTEPEVQVLDAQGTPVPLQFDSESRCYSVATDAAEIPEAHRQALVTAAETYCKYMIRGATQADLRESFDRDSEIYQTIIRSEIWLQNYASYQLSEVTVSDYYCYEDGYFSGRILLTLSVTRKNGTTKEYTLNNTLFVKKTDDQWKVCQMVNLNVQEPITHVLLTYVSQDQVIHKEMVDTAGGKLTLPQVTAPEGKTFTGWFLQRKSEDGNTTMELIFEPSEDGVITLPPQTVSEPMTLYALYQ